MRVGIMADTHDNLDLVAEALEQFKKNGVEAIIHAGDFVAPFTLAALLEPGIPLTGVFGNNDGEREGLKQMHEDLHEPPYSFGLGGLQFVLGHDEEKLTAEDTEGSDVVVVAHTHEPTVEVGPPMVINPGETGGWLTGSSTVALLDTEEMRPEILQLQLREE